MKFVVEACDSMGNSFRKCTTGTDDRGSIRLAWQNINGDGAVRLVCPFNADKKSYIYHVSGEHRSKDITSAATLVYWLEWFKKV